MLMLNVVTLMEASCAHAMLDMQEMALLALVVSVCYFRVVHVASCKGLSTPKERRGHATPHMPVEMQNAGGC